MLKKLLDKNLQLTIIGGGNISQALIAGLIKSKTFDSRQITIGEKDQEKLSSLKLKYEINTSKNNLEAIQNSDITILAVKPQDFPRVSSEIKPADFSRKILLSVLAGTTLSTLKSSLNLTKMVRVMPNTPCLIQQGMSAWHSENLSEDENYTVRKILQSLGLEMYFEEERFLDMATALSGTGPAYIFLMAESMIDSGVNMGLPREKAKILTYQTILGSILYAQHSNLHPAILKNEITSPAGTTAAALKVLEKNSFRHTIIEAIQQAFLRSQEMSQKK